MIEENDKPGVVGVDRSLLLVDDDQPFLLRLARAMEKRGFEVRTAATVGDAVALAAEAPPAYAVVDKIGRASCRERV